MTLTEIKKACIPCDNPYCEMGRTDNCFVAVSNPIAKHHPSKHTVVAHQKKTEAIIVPSLDLAEASDSNAEFEDWALEIYEWLGLTSLNSPRLIASDDIDPYLSRYRIPAANSERATPCNLVKLSWNALVPALWIRELFIALM